MSKALEELCHHTDTEPKDWDEISGPETGVGIERYYLNIKTREVYYVCDDQGEISVSCSGKG